MLVITVKGEIKIPQAKGEGVVFIEYVTLILICSINYSLILSKSLINARNNFSPLPPNCLFDKPKSRLISYIILANLVR